MLNKSKLLKILTVISAIAATFAISGKVIAEEAEIKTPVNFNFFLGEYNVVKKQSQVGGSNDSETTEVQNSQNLNKSFMALPYKDVALYLYPFTDGGRYFSVGYSITGKLELGLDLERGTVKNKNANTSSSLDTLGYWAAWYDSIGSVGIEAVLTYDITWAKTTTKNAVTSQLDTVSDRVDFIKPNVQFVFPISKNAFYFNGIGYAVVKDKSGTDLDTRHVLNLTLAGVRVCLKP